MAERGKPVLVAGILRVRDHCTFSWQEPEGGGPRAVEVRPEHCEACIAKLKKRGYRLVYPAEPK